MARDFSRPFAAFRDGASLAHVAPKLVIVGVWGAVSFVFAVTLAGCAGGTSPQLRGSLTVLTNEAQGTPITLAQRTTPDLVGLDDEAQGK